MRGQLAALASPHPIARTLPGLYRDESFVERFCSALDEVIAPVIATIDNWPSYIDVETTPEDLLPWLAAWTGMTLDPGQSRDRQRLLLRQAVALQGRQGTRRGIELAVEAVFGLPAQVQETGASTWSMEAQTPLPGEPQQALVLQVFASAGVVVDEERLDLVVEGLKPAHVVHRVEVVRT